MNYFYGIKNKEFNSELQVPLFQNRNPKPQDIYLYKAVIENSFWKISKMNNCKVNEDFYVIDSNNIESSDVFFLAFEKDLNNFDNTKLKDFNNFTNTTPAFRANLKILLNEGGFSSYQSEYPYSMIAKKGTLLSSVNSIANKEAEKNFIFIRNIYEKPINEKYFAYIVDVKKKKVEEKIEIQTNYTNSFELNKSLIKPEMFLITDKYLGIPMFVSIDQKHVSFEHTQPPHEYILGKNKFKKISELKKEINEIVN